MDGQRFDELTRVMATAPSRRRVLGILAGGPAAALGGRPATRAQTNAGGNEACDAFCHAVFDDTREAGQCTAAAAQGAGPCFACGPAAEACPAGKERTSTTEPCECACIPVVCDPNFTQDAETCECVCALDESACPSGFEFDEAACACECPNDLCGAAGAEVCCAPEQDCGLVGIGSPGCCLPPGAAIPDGCSPGTIDQCCGFLVGDDQHFRRSCNIFTGTCGDPRTVSVSAASVATSQYITQVIAR